MRPGQLVTAKQIIPDPESADEWGSVVAVEVNPGEWVTGELVTFDRRYAVEVAGPDIYDATAPVMVDPETPLRWIGPNPYDEQE